MASTESAKSSWTVWIARLTRAIVPVALIAIVVAALWVLIAVAENRVERHGASPARWGEVISLAAIVLVSVLIYGTGAKRRTVSRAFTFGSGETAIRYEVDTALTDEEYDDLSADEKKNVTWQRGLYFRALYSGADGRWSTSKTQALLWTFAVLWALLAIFIALNLGDTFKLVLEDGKKTSRDFGDLVFAEQYLILIGGYFAAAVLAKGITSSKVEGGEVKPPVEETRSAAQGVKDLVTTDAGKADLGDTQFFFFNLLALTVFFAGIIPHLDEGLPNLPTFLVGLTSVSAAIYVGKKTVESTTPKIADVIPSVARAGTTVRVEGSYLATSETFPPRVKIDGTAVAPVKVESVSGTLGATSAISFVVPPEIAAGTDKELSVQPVGATVPATGKITIASATITAVAPTTVPWREGVQLEITGSGFGPNGSVAVKLAGHPLVVQSWTDSQIIARTTSDFAGAPPDSSATLQLSRDEKPIASRSTAVELTAMVISAVDPTPLTLLKGTPLKLTGSGFGPPPGGTVALGDDRLEIAAWSDTQIVAVLGAQFPPAQSTPATLSVRVERAGYASASLPVAVARPGITVSDVVPSPVPKAAGTVLVVHGSGFGADGDSAVSGTLGGAPLTISERSETRLKATLVDAITPTSSTADLVLSREGWTNAVKALTVG
jgi:hypothetical protein